MWSSTNRSKMMLRRRLLTTQQCRQLAVIVTFAAFAMQAFTGADAQNSALSATTPKLVNGALATAAATAAATNPLSNCSAVRSLFESQGINGADIPQQPVTGKFSIGFLFIISLNHHVAFDSDSFSKSTSIFIYLVGRPVDPFLSPSVCMSVDVFRIKRSPIYRFGSNPIAYSKNFVSILLLSISVSLTRHCGPCKYSAYSVCASVFASFSKRFYA